MLNFLWSLHRSVDQEQQEQDEYLEVEDNDMYEDYSTATPDQHRDENIGQEQDTMTMESGLNRRSSLCSMCGSRSRCLRVETENDSPFIRSSSIIG